MEEGEVVMMAEEALKTSQPTSQIDVGDFIVLQLPYIPYAYLPLQVVRVEGRSTINMPEIFSLPQNSRFTSLISGTLISPADSVIPEFSYSSPFTISFPALSALWNTDNIFEVPEGRGYNDALIYYTLRLNPGVVKVLVEAPAGTAQNFYQFGRVSLTPDAPFGLRRGAITLAHPPSVVLYFRVVNDTNMILKASLAVDYSELRVIPIPDPYIVYELIRPVLNIYMPLSDDERRRHLRAQEEIARRRVFRIQLPLAQITGAVQTILTKIYGRHDNLVRSRYNTREEALESIVRAVRVMRDGMSTGSE